MKDGPDVQFLNRATGVALAPRQNNLIKQASAAVISVTCSWSPLYDLVSFHCINVPRRHNEEQGEQRSRRQNETLKKGINMPPMNDKQESGGRRRSGNPPRQGRAVERRGLVTTGPPRQRGTVARSRFYATARRWSSAADDAAPPPLDVVCSPTTTTTTQRLSSLRGFFATVAGGAESKGRLHHFLRSSR